VPRAPGGGTDILARALLPVLMPRLGQGGAPQTIVIENRADATSIIGTEIVARAAPDGQVIAVVDNAFYQNPAIIPHLPYDTLRDFSAVTMLAEAPVVLLASPALTVRDVAGLVALAKARPGELSFASGGVGASTHFAGVLFNLEAGVEMIHVPFRSSGPALTAVLGSQVSIGYGGLSSARPLIEAGQVRALAVTGPARDPALPAVPTFAEIGLGAASVTSVWGMHAPAGTPLGLRRRLRDAVAASFAEPALARRLAELGYSLLASTPEAHQAETERLVALWQRVAQRVRLDQ
jgi:tripartite-type tricarboxylate transporter receptor subunit TctC